MKRRKLLPHNIKFLFYRTFRGTRYSEFSQGDEHRDDKNNVRIKEINDTNLSSLRSTNYSIQTSATTGSLTFCGHNIRSLMLSMRIAKTIYYLLTCWLRLLVH